MKLSALEMKQPWAQMAKAGTTGQQSLSGASTQSANIPQSRPLQKCLWHPSQEVCSSSSVSGSRYPTFAARQQPGSSSGWRAARCHFLRHGPQWGLRAPRPGATLLQPLPLWDNRWGMGARRERKAIWVLETSANQMLSPRGQRHINGSHSFCGMPRLLSKILFYLYAPSLLLYCVTLLSALLPTKSFNNSRSIILTPYIHSTSTSTQNTTKIKEHSRSKVKCEKPGDSNSSIILTSSLRSFLQYKVALQTQKDASLIGCAFCASEKAPWARQLLEIQG